MENQDISKISVSIENISPKQAAAYLDQNIENRPKRDARIISLANQIRRDEWFVIPNGIGFDTDGILIDGQHRLSAIELSGKTAPIIVARGLSKECKKVIDSGVKRTFSDQNGLPKKINSACNFIAKEIVGLTRTEKGNTSSTAKQLEEIWVKIEPIYSELPLLSTNRKCFGSPSFKVGGLAAIMLGENKEYVIDILSDFDGDLSKNMNDISFKAYKAINDKTLNIKSYSIALAHFCLGLFISKKSNKNRSILSLKNDDVTNKLIEESREVFRELLK